MSTDRSKIRTEILCWCIDTIKAATIHSVGTDRLLPCFHNLARRIFPLPSGVFHHSSLCSFHQPLCRCTDANCASFLLFPAQAKNLVCKARRSLRCGTCFSTPLQNFRWTHRPVRRSIAGIPTHI